VFGISNTAIILGQLRRNGEPNRAAVHELIRSGALALVDPTQPITRWTVSAVEIRRYIEHGPRTGADVVQLKGVS
jgi:hypothetical protein